MWGPVWQELPGGRCCVPPSSDVRCRDCASSWGSATGSRDSGSVLTAASASSLRAAPSHHGECKCECLGRGWRMSATWGKGGDAGVSCAALRQERDSVLFWDRTGMLSVRRQDGHAVLPRERMGMLSIPGQDRDAVLPGDTDAGLPGCSAAGTWWYWPSGRGTLLADHLLTVCAIIHRGGWWAPKCPLPPAPDHPSCWESSIPGIQESQGRAAAARPAPARSTAPPSPPSLWAPLQGGWTWGGCRTGTGRSSEGVQGLASIGGHG